MYEPKISLTDFRSSIETTHKVWSDVVFRCVRSRTKIAQLQDRLVFVDLTRKVNQVNHKSQMEWTYQNIIWFDICMHNIGFPQQTQRQEQLMSVCTNSSNIQTDILSEALYDVTKIHTEFKGQGEEDERK